MGRGNTAHQALDVIVDRIAPPPSPTSFWHVGYVVPDLDAALDVFEERLGSLPFLVFREPEIADETVDGKPCKPRQSLAFGYAGNLGFEVIAPLDGGDESSYTRFLDEHPQGGMHHTAIMVERFEDGLRDLGMTADDVVQYGRFNEDTRFGYVPAPGLGTYLEVIQFDAGTRQLFEDLRQGRPAVTR